MFSLAHFVLFCVFMAFIFVTFVMKMHFTAQVYVQSNDQIGFSVDEPVAFKA